MKITTGKHSIKKLREKHAKAISSLETHPGELNGAHGNILALLLEGGHVEIKDEKPPRPPKVAVPDDEEFEDE